MGQSKKRAVAFAALLALALTGCVDRTPREVLAFTPQSLERRQAQTRIFDSADEAQMLAAAAGVLQDLGFTIDESETDLGVIVSSKRRDAREFSQVIESAMTKMYFGVMSLGLYWGAGEPIDDVQEIQLSLVTAPVGESGDRIEVRITVQRIVWDVEGEVTRRETIIDPAIYQEFFSALSTSLFLEAHRI